MRSIRVHVNLPLAPDAALDLPGAAALHVIRVLRLGVGAAVTLFNGDGLDYAGTLVAAGKRGARVEISGSAPVPRESPLALTLAQGIARGDKMDWIVQKATELGVARIVPLLTERSQVRLDAARARKRIGHWQAVAAGACEQCGRARVPEITAAQELGSWLAGLDPACGQRLALLPTAGAHAHDLVFDVPAGVLVVGPEGGLGERDLDALRGAGFAGLALGPRTLRTETAGIVALAALQAVHGDV